MTPSDPGARWRAWADRVERTLDAALPPATDAPKRLHTAMRYAVLGGGKRMRPLLVYATGTALGVPEADLDIPAAAVELIHAYSLVHDDLPAMDDDDLRRGKPTVHVAFDEGTAILVGDALLTLAFELLSRAEFDASVTLAMVRELAQASGARTGMVAGQALDLAAVGQSLDIDELRRMHAGKTGALIRASVRLGALAAKADRTTREALDDYANALGLAFQIRDDILDVEGESKTIGKTPGKDAANNKPNYPALLGIDASVALIGSLKAAMDAALSGTSSDTSELAALARFASQRGH